MCVSATPTPFVECEPSVTSPLDRDQIRPLGRSRRSGPALHGIAAGTADAWPLTGPLLALVAGWALMVWPWLSGAVTIPWDAKAQFLPQIQFLAQSLARGESPLWAPYVFAGQNQIADPQSMMFTPPFLLLALVNGNPSAWAVDVTTLLAELAGGAALLLWFRDRGWHWAGALMGGLTFAFGASMAWRLQHTGQVLSLAYWPMAMFALDRSLDRRSYGWAVVLGLVAAAIILGRDQVALLVLYLLAAFALSRVFSATEPWAVLRSVLPHAALAAVVTVALAAVPVVLTALLASDSNRPVIDIEGAGRGSLHPALLITALVPQLFGAAFRMEDYWGPPSFAWNDTGLFIAQNMGQIYIGVLPVLLIVLATVRGQMWAPEIRFFTAAFGLVVLYALGWYTPFFQVAYTLLPGVNLYRRPADATFVIGALGAVLAGYATHRLFERPWEQVQQRAWITIGGVAAVTLFCAFVLALRIDRLALLTYPFVAAGLSCALAIAALLIARPRLALEPRMAALVLCGAVACDLAWNNGPSSSSGLPPAAYDVFDPDTKDPVIATLKAHVDAGRSDVRRDRIELLGLGFHWPNASLTHRLENTLGYNPVRSRLYSEATGAGDNIGSPGERKFTPLLPSYRSRLVDMLGLRYVAAGAPLETLDPKLQPGDWQFIGKAGEAWIYENPRALPRVSFATRALPVDFAALLKTGAWPSFDQATTVLLGPADATDPGTGAATTDTPASVRLITYGHTSIDIEATSSTGGYVVLNDPFHPWWFADIDGQSAPVLQANVLFRAVRVAPGTHRVRFTFRPFVGAWQQLSSVTR